MGSTSEPRPVLYHVQVLRLIAASGIMLAHAVKMFHAPAKLFWTVPWTAGVEIFFVISGFIMTYLTQEQFGAPGASRTFIVRRAVRIVPAYWFFTLLLVAIFPIVNDDMRDKVVTAPWLTASLGFVPWLRESGKLNPVLAQGWTLNYEAFFYVLFGLALLWRRGIWLVCLGLVVLVVCGRFIPEAWYVLKFWAQPIVLAFVGGIVLAFVHRRGVRLPWFGRLACIVAGAAAYLILRQHQGILVGAWIIAAGFILSDQPLRLRWGQRVLLSGGDASYTIYLSHTIVIGLLVAAWRYVAPGWPWLGVWVSVIASYAFAAAFYRWIEKPVTRALHRRFG